MTKVLISLFEQLGLRAEHAEIYEILLKQGPAAAGMIAKKSRHQRTYVYKLLDELVDHGACEKRGKGARFVFAPQAPTVLKDKAEELLRQRIDDLASVKDEIPKLQVFYEHGSEKPVVRYFQGVEGVRSIYDEHLQLKNRSHFFFRPQKSDVYNVVFGPWFKDFLKRQREANIRVYGITPEDGVVHVDDEKRNFHRTLVRADDYTVPVEIASYGNTVTIISFGKEIFGLAIDHAPIAQAIKEIFLLAKRGADTIHVPKK
ncbi:hypothetical protein KBC55_03825 [Patescibacteria group bacterium]|nr:hypothetical protein [Patescibacteria group bacterium]